MQTISKNFNIHQDKIIRNLVACFDDKVFKYDENGLIIYADPSLKSVLLEFAGFLLTNFIGEICFSIQNKYAKVLSFTFFR